MAVRRSADVGWCDDRRLAAEVEDELECVVDCSQLVERQLPDLRTERAGIDGTDHLAHHARRLLADGYLGMEAPGGVELDVGQTRIVESARRSSACTTTAKRRPRWTAPRCRGSMIA